MKNSNFLNLILSVKMSTKLITLLSSLILLSISSCIPEDFNTQEDICTVDCYFVEGFVYDESTGEGLEDATVYLWYNDPGWGASTDAIVTTTTDEKGFYSLPYTGANYIDGTGQMAIVVKKEGYIGFPIEPSAYSVELVEVRADPPVVRNFDLIPSAELEYNIILKTTDLDDLEYVWCIASWGSVSTHVLANNPKTDTIILDDIAADQPVDIWCRYYKENQDVTEDKSTIVIPKGERKSVDIEVR